MIPAMYVLFTSRTHDTWQVRYFRRINYFSVGNRNEHKEYEDIWWTPNEQNCLAISCGEQTQFWCDGWWCRLICTIYATLMLSSMRARTTHGKIVHFAPNVNRSDPLKHMYDVFISILNQYIVVLFQIKIYFF